MYLIFENFKDKENFKKMSNVLWKFKDEWEIHANTGSVKISTSAGVLTPQLKLCLKTRYLFILHNIGLLKTCWRVPSGEENILTIFVTTQSSWD